MAGEHKLKAGAVYRMNAPDGSVEEFICWATVDRKGTRSAWIQRFGHAKQVITEKSEMFASMEPIGDSIAAKETKPAKKPAAKKTVSKKTSAKASK